MTYNDWIRSLETSNCKILEWCQFTGNYTNTKYIMPGAGCYSLVLGAYPLYSRVNEAWCKVGNKTLGPLQSVRAKGKRWGRLFESGVPNFFSEV